MAWSAQRYEQFWSEAAATLRTKQQALEDGFQLAAWDRYDWDQDAGEIVFSNGGESRRVIADIDFVGSVSSKSETWLWAWGNPTVEPPMKARVEQVRAFGEARGLDELTRAKWPADQTDGWTMAAVAAQILDAAGVYRSPDEAGWTFLLLSNPRFVEA